MGTFLSLFNGNSSSVFVILAGMGVALMTGKADYPKAERDRLKGIILKRSAFLFVAGILVNLWWPADILHFYAGYLHVAAAMLFLPKRFFLWGAGAAVLIFHVLLAIVPYETGWNFDTLAYTDFWTVPGFLRNTLYNGWNPIFPWVAYFLAGMWLGRLNWADTRLPGRVFLAGACLYLVTTGLQMYAGGSSLPDEVRFYFTADYLPPFLPFMLNTTGFGLMLIAGCIALGRRVEHKRVAQVLAATGRMTLTHYVQHLTLGLVLLSVFSGHTYTGHLAKEAALAPVYILGFAVVYFAASCAFTAVWLKKYNHGPLEGLMRKVSG